MNDDDLAYRLTYEVRTLFHRMVEAVDALHENTGVTTAMRAVMECLAGGQEKSVPQIARERSVSRQHIQTLANALLDRDLIRTKVNPDHKRSQLVYLTDEGERLFRSMRLKERKTMETLGGLASRRDLQKTVATLETLNGYFETMTKGKPHETV